MDEPDEGLRGRPIEAAELKALAHPLRIQLLEMLLDVGPATASSLGRLTGESSGTTSYHLRRLAGANLIIEAPQMGTGRDRYWRAVGGWSLEADLIQSPATSADARVVIDELTRTSVQRLRRWNAESERWPQQWREHALNATTRLTLDAQQMRDLGQELLAVIGRYRQAQQTSGTPSTSRVIVEAILFPTGSPPHD